MEKDSVSISFVKEALQGVRARGLDADGLLRSVGISPALLGARQARVSAESFSALWLAVAAALDDEFFGLDSRRMKVGSFAALSYLMLHTRTLRAALGRALRFFHIVLDDTRVSVGENGQTAHLSLLPTHSALAAGLPVRPFAHETLLVMLHGLMCWLIGRRIPILQAEFAYPMPARWREYTVMYSQNLAFGRDATTLRFDADFLAAPVVRTETAAKEFLRGAPYNIVLKYKDQHSWSARVRHALRDTPPADWPSFEALAAALEVGPSALRRRLEKEASSFQTIKDDLRRDMAIERLSHSELAVPEIAHALGFAEPSAFHRAFKQWTGVRPGEYRRKRAQGLLPEASPDGATT